MEVVPHLLVHPGIDYGVVDKEGRTALDHARSQQYFKYFDGDSYYPRDILTRRRKICLLLNAGMFAQNR